jgi:hypothetical protein
MRMKKCANPDCHVIKPIKAERKYCSRECAKPAVRAALHRAHVKWVQQANARWASLTPVQMAEKMRLRFSRKAHRQGYAAGYLQAVKDMEKAAKFQRMVAP